MFDGCAVKCSHVHPHQTGTAMKLALSNRKGPFENCCYKGGNDQFTLQIVLNWNNLNNIWVQGCHITFVHRECGRQNVEDKKYHNKQELTELFIPLCTCQSMLPVDDELKKIGWKVTFEMKLSDLKLMAAGESHATMYSDDTPNS